MVEPKAEVELAVREAWDAQDLRRAATLAFEAFGPEVLGYLVARLRSVSDAQEAFSMCAEDFWKGLPGFSFRCSVRGWLYVLARNAANRYVTSPQRRAELKLLSQEAELSAVVGRVQSTAQFYLRSDVKQGMRALREALPEADQSLLILHVDKGLPWREIALVLNEGAEVLEPVAIERETARLRKRFERVKAELRASAVEAGLLEL
jgi:RNA polymerase sigma factor (sigma-70 family)